MQAILKAILMAQTPMGKKNKTRKHHWHPLVFQAQTKKLLKQATTLDLWLCPKQWAPNKSDSFKNIRSSCEKRWFETSWSFQKIMWPIWAYPCLPDLQPDLLLLGGEGTWEVAVPLNGLFLNTHKYCYVLVGVFFCNSIHNHVFEKIFPSTWCLFVVCDCEPYEPFPFGRESWDLWCLPQV